MTPSVRPFPYTKPYKTVAEQLALLKSRGMHVSDEEAARFCLQRIGYYRLSGYWFPFRKSRPASNPLTGVILVDPFTRKEQVVIEDDFRAGTTFRAVMDLYVFDKRLRLLFLDALERIEIAIRVDIALLLGTRDPWAHRDPNQLHGRFTKATPGTPGQPDFKSWLRRLDNSFTRSKDEFATHFKRKYQGEEPPIWIAIEMWDFGMLSVFLSGMKHADQSQLASRYGIPRPELLVSWIRNLNHIRNICAHHGRLWNRSPADQISPPKVGEITLLDHVAASPLAVSRVYSSACIIQFLLKRIHPGSSWGERVKTHCHTLPKSNVVALSNAGFPINWESLPLWQ